MSWIKQTLRHIHIFVLDFGTMKQKKKDPRDRTQYEQVIYVDDIYNDNKQKQKKYKLSLPNT